MGLLNLIKGGVSEYNKHQQFLLEWQNAIMASKQDRLTVTEKELKDLTIQQMLRDFEIVQDCLRIIDTTKNPDTFFSRLNLMKDKCRHIYKLDAFVPFSSLNKNKITAKDLFNEIVNNYDDAIQDFIMSYFKTFKENAMKLKTSKARIRQYEKFYTTLEPYFMFMGDDHIEYIENKYNAYTNNELRKE